MTGTPTYTLKLRYFAWLRERTRTAEETLAVPASIADVRGLIEWLGEQSPGHAAAFANAKMVRCAVNQAFAEPDMLLSDGDEVAFFPPVTGG